VAALPSYFAISLRSRTRIDDSLDVFAGHGIGGLTGALLTGGSDTIAVRMPDHQVPRRLARALGPLAVSSANLSGEPDARSAREALDALGAAVAFVLDDGPSPAPMPSTVVRVVDGEDPEVLRVGAIPASEIGATASG